MSAVPVVLIVLIVLVASLAFYSLKANAVVLLALINAVSIAGLWWLEYLKRR